MIVEIIMFIALLILTGLICMLDIAFVSIDFDEVDIDAIAGNEDAKKVKKVKNKFGKYINALRSMITFCSLFLGAMAAEMFGIPIYKKIEESITPLVLNISLKYVFILLATVLVSYLTYIVAQIIPRHIAIKYNKKIIYKNIGIIKFFEVISRPFTYIVDITDSMMIKLLKVSKKEKDIILEDELKKDIELEYTKGLISKGDKEVIQNFMRIEKITVKDVMRNMDEIVFIKADSTKEELLKKIKKYAFTRYPVYEENLENVIGVLHIKALLSNIQKEKINVKTLLTKHIEVTERRRLSSVFEEMQKEKTQMAIIKNDKHEMVGLITIEDILAVIIGRIDDEYEGYHQIFLKGEK